MIDSDLLNILKKHRNREKLIIKYNFSLYKNIVNWNKKYLKEDNWNIILYNYVYCIKSKPICKNNGCNKTVKFGRSYINGYNEFCSHNCRASDINILNKRKISSIKKYGVEHPSQSKEIKKKIKQTNLKRYGVEYPSILKIFKEKIKQTNLKKYGVESPIQNKEIKEKIKQTNLDRYGIEYPSKLKIFKEKIKQTNLDKYGVEHTFQSKELKEKTKKTNLDRYGIEIASKSDLVKNRIINTVNKKTIIDFSKILNINEEDIFYDNNNLIIKNYCKKHLNGFKINLRQLYSRFYVLKHKNICTKCNPISELSSIKEKEVVDFIKTLNINFIENDKTILNGKELDIYLPDNKLAIEFNGLYYHSELFKDKNYHLNKTVECEKQGIQLLHIFEDEWIYKSDIVKSIIKSKLGLIENKIYGRKCIIKEIESKTSKDFLNRNHIQGNVNSSIRIGLFYNDELVSLMTFGKKRIVMGSKSKDGEYEMYRFCNKLNTSVIGGASKLFKYFIKNYNPKEVISYGDRRYFDGKMYENIGFKLESISKPNFWYSKNLERHYRFGFRKDVLVKEGYNPNKTAQQIMIERGYNRIYDSGNLKYKFI